MSIEIRRPLPTGEFQTDKAIQLLYEEIRKVNIETQRLNVLIGVVSDSIDDILFITLQDSGSNYWKVSLTESGGTTTTAVPTGTIDVIVLEDSGSTKWDLGITVGGVLTLSSGSSGTVEEWIITTALGKQYKLGVTVGGALTTTLQ